MLAPGDIIYFGTNDRIDDWFVIIISTNSEFCMPSLCIVLRKTNNSWESNLLSIGLSVSMHEMLERKMFPGDVCWRRL